VLFILSGAYAMVEYELLLLLLPLLFTLQAESLKKDYLGKEDYSSVQVGRRWEVLCELVCEVLCEPDSCGEVECEA
jgi:hypothetical protein